MSTTPVTSATATTPAATDTTTASGAFKADSNTFMTLLVENMKHQDPMQPQDSTAFMQQISQMTMVEQLTQLADTQSTAKTLGLLGHTVTYTDTTGATLSGVVQGVNLTSQGPKMTVDGVGGVDPASVIEVS